MGVELDGRSQLEAQTSDSRNFTLASEASDCDIYKVRGRDFSIARHIPGSRPAECAS